MPLYMDIHRGMEGLTAEGVAEAHRRDLKAQGKHDVKLRKYWFNDREGEVFCLAEAPSKEAFAAVHLEANGFTADEIIEVSEGK